MSDAETVLMGISFDMLSRAMSREEYEEFHEPRWEQGEAEPEGVAEDSEEDTEDCPYCKHDAYCKGGCRNGIKNYTPYHSERKEG